MSGIGRTKVINQGLFLKLLAQCSYSLYSTLLKNLDFSCRLPEFESWFYYLPIGDFGKLSHHSLTEFYSL